MFTVFHGVNLNLPVYLAMLIEPITRWMTSLITDQAGLTCVWVTTKTAIESAFFQAALITETRYTVRTSIVGLRFCNTCLFIYMY